MKIMNKKGFTLVELLAVLVILGILVTIAVPAATSVSDKAKNKMLKTKTKLAMQGAILYLQDNKSEFTSQTNLNNCTTNNNVITCHMTFLKLADLGQLDYDYTDDNGVKHIQNPVDKTNMDNAYIIVTYNKLNRSVDSLDACYSAGKSILFDNNSSSKKC